MRQTTQTTDEAYVAACDLCGSSDATELPHCRTYTGGQPIHVCDRCGFVFVRNRRSAADIARSWSEEIYGDGYTAYLPAVRARHMFVASFIDQEIGLAGRSVVDIGAGEGAFLAMLRDMAPDIRVFGIEPSTANCQRMRAQGIECFEGTIEDFTREGGTNARPDLVTVLWTLENCRSCRDMLDAAWDLLPEGGRLVVATGSRILVPFKKPLHHYLGPRDADTHCFRFSANTLQALVRVSGFEVEAVNRYVDNDILVVVARKANRRPDAAWSGDDPVAVRDFFDRWHRDTEQHFPREDERP